ncbi:DUF6916 family protein [Leifsonia sp. NPDC058194]|uniref:DUF6916 family protein n=1 Tax=Leifsonia sp. NPDC058194 TaxID=3346374 RepID=UPI0036DD1471
MSRRTVMASALGGLGVAVLLPAAPALARTGSAPLAAAAAAPATAEAVRSLFTPAIGRPFVASDSERTIHLVLTDVDDLSAEAAGDEHRFLLLFSADSGATDGIYTLSRSGTPDVSLFLSPIGRPGLTRTMQAVVNRTA